MGQVLVEEIPVEVPQIQTAEVLRQDAVAQTKEVVKQIPRVSMQYRERVMEMREQIQQENVAPAPAVEYITAAPAIAPIVTEYVAPAPAVEYITSVPTALPSIQT